MTNYKFVATIVKLYHDARKPYFPNPDLLRGEGRSISSIVEDLFAKYTLEATNRRFKILINQPLSYFVHSHRYNIKPDLTLIQGDKIVCLVDLKTDIGYNRKGFFSQCKHKNNSILRIRGKNLSGQKLIGYKKNPFELRAIKGLVYHTVIISGENISRKRMETIKFRFKTLKASALYVLTINLHPNQSTMTVNETMSKINIVNSEFSKFLSKIKRV